jgi:hypothetical protein
MAQKRPAAVTVMGVLNLVFGGLRLLGLLCLTGAGLVGMLFIMNMPAPPPGQANEMAAVKDLINDIDQAVPEMKYMMIAELALGVVMTLLLIVAGIGLLRMRPWGRTLSLVYAVVTVIVTPAAAIYSAASLEPRMQQVMSKWEEQQRQKQRGAGGAAPAPTKNPFGGGVGGLIGAVFGSAYSIALLIVLNLAHVRRAFTGAGRRGRDGDEDEDGNGRPRRREGPEDFDDRHDRY